MNNYFSIDDILSEEEKVEVTTLFDATDLGWLHAENLPGDLPKDSKVELPIWLSKALKKRNMISVKCPKFYFDKQILAAPHAMNLKVKSNYFFEAGIKIYQMIKNKSLMLILQNIFSSLRFKRLLDFSLHFVCKDPMLFYKDLTNLEKKLFVFAQQAAMDHFLFKTRKHIVIKCKHKCK